MARLPSWLGYVPRAAGVTRQPPLINRRYDSALGHSYTHR